MAQQLRDLFPFLSPLHPPNKPNKTKHNNKKKAQLERSSKATQKQNQPGNYNQKPILFFIFLFWEGCFEGKACCGCQSASSSSSSSFVLWMCDVRQPPNPKFQISSCDLLLFSFAVFGATQRKQKWLSSKQDKLLCCACDCGGYKSHHRASSSPSCMHVSFCRFLPCLFCFLLSLPVDK